MKSPIFKQLSLALAAAGACVVASQANAAPTCPETADPAANYKCVFFNVGTSFSPTDADSKTSAFYELGYTGTLATSIYSPFNLPSTPSNIVDSNIKQVLNYYGLTGGPANYTTLAGNQVSLKDTPDNPGERNIDQLNGPSAGRDTERFDAANDLPNLGWGLTYNTLFTGTLDASGPHFNGGYIDFFFQNWLAGTSEQVLRVLITGSQLDPANLSLFGKVSFDWTGGANDQYGLATADGANDCTSVLCQQFWNLQTATPSDFYTLEGNGIVIQMALDTNVNPPIPQDTQLVEFTGADGNKYWIRQTTLDGSVRFNVPEPGSLALLGLGLLGLAARRARKA